MKSSKLTAFLILTLSMKALAITPTELNHQINSLESRRIDDNLKIRIEELKSRNIVLKSRPKFCPLNSTRALADLKQGLENIEASFQGNCLDGNQALISQVLNETQNIQTQISQAILSSKAEAKPDTENASESPLEEPPTIPGTNLNGQQLASVINGINQVFTQNKCSNLNSSTFMESAANIIQSFSQLGLYSPNPQGITIAFGGLAVASTLRLISSLFNSRFNFTKSNQDRETFVKLNCAYYDLRNQMQEAAILEISTEQHFKDLKEVKEIIPQLENILKQMNNERSALLKNIEEVKIEEHTLASRELDELLKSLHELIKDPIIDQPGLPALDKRNLILDELTFNHNNLVSSLESGYFFSSSGKSLSRSNKTLRELLDKIDEDGHGEEVRKLEKMDIPEFNQDFLNRLSYHFLRVRKELSKENDQKEEKDYEDTLITVNHQTLKVKDIRQRLKEGEAIQENFANIKENLQILRAIKARLEFLTSKKEFSSTDSNDGNLLRILEANDNIKNYIYGKYGKEFISDMVVQAKDLNADFIEDSYDFAVKYMEGDFEFENHSNHGYNNDNDNHERERPVVVHINNLKIKNPANTNEDEKQLACVTAKSLREKWRYAQRWAELGYDFLSTNNDLISDDNAGDREEILRQAHSAILARRIISAQNSSKKYSAQDLEREVFIHFHGEKYTIEQAIKVLNKRTTTWGKKRIGHIMLDINESRKMNVKLQELDRTYRCDLISNFDQSSSQ